jgi:hypothetical protein
MTGILVRMQLAMQGMEQDHIIGFSNQQLCGTLVLHTMPVRTTFVSFLLVTFLQYILFFSRFSGTVGTSPN